MPSFYSTFRLWNFKAGGPKKQDFCLLFSIMKLSVYGTFFVKIIFDHFNFWYTLFSKIMPNVWRTVIHCCIYKVQIFILIFGQKSCFLEPTPFWNSTTEMTLVNKYIISAPPQLHHGRALHWGAYRHGQGKRGCWVQWP